MQIEARQVDGVLVVKMLARRIDASSAPEFKERMLDWIGNGNRLIVLDLSSTDFMDSSALGVLVSSLKTIGASGDIALCGVRETVMTVFRLTRLNRVFRFFDTEEEAVRGLSAG
jgi:anti-sigma B factor antagonist